MAGHEPTIADKPRKPSGSRKTIIELFREWEALGKQLNGIIVESDTANERIEALCHQRDDISKKIYALTPVTAGEMAAWLYACTVGFERFSEDEAKIALGFIAAEEGDANSFEASGSSSVTRRSLLALAGSFSLGFGAGLFPPAAKAETPVMSLFREWDAAQAGWKNVPSDDESGDAYCFYCGEIVTRLVAAPCERGEDWAAKIVAVGSWVGFEGGSVHDERLMADATEIMRAHGFRDRHEVLGV